MGGLGLNQIDQAMARGVQENVFPGAVLLWAQKETILYHKAFGIKDLTTGAPVQPDTFFDLASLTKPLATALAVAELIKSKALETFTPLARLIPETLGTDKAQITIDMLLRHTSGLPAHRKYFKNLKGPGQNSRQVLRRLILEEPLDVQPGMAQTYSDLGYMVLAWVVENIANQGVDAFVYERIYHPLNINHLFFMASGENHQGSGDFCAATQDCPWRGKLLKGEVEDENAWAVGGIEGHAGLFGDAVSIHRLCCEIMDALTHNHPKVLDSGILQSFVNKTPGRDRVAGFDTPSPKNSSSGHYFSKSSVGHLGFTGTSFWMDPETGLIVILLTNRVHPRRDNLQIKSFRPKLHDLVALAYNRNIRV
ncbi:MAG: beta-lactamase family protein [Desulfobacter sp.]|nr:MAG: beta-lactamase family protein [Desulfobacter sp.]